MRRLQLAAWQVAIALWVAPAACAQPDRVAVPLTDPSRPVELKASLMNGSITVKAYDGKEVIVQAQTHQRDRGRRGESDAERTRGMRRVPMTATGLDVQEENNTVTVNASWQNVNLDIQVPVRTSVKLKSVQNGSIHIEGVEGDAEAQGLNGSVTLANVAGSAVVHALNGRVKAVFTRVDPGKAMSFTSLNGAIDVTFPAGLKANVKIKSERGEVWSDFDIVTRSAPRTAIEDSRDGKGKYRVRLDRWVYGTINGGGQEIQFSSLNGPIYIRKGQ